MRCERQIVTASTSAAVSGGDWKHVFHTYGAVFPNHQLNAAHFCDLSVLQGREGPVTSSTGAEEPLPSNHQMQLNVSASSCAVFTSNPLSRPDMTNKSASAVGADGQTALSAAWQHAGLTAAWDNLAANGIATSTVLDVLQNEVAQGTSLNHTSPAESGHLHPGSFTAPHRTTQLQHNKKLASNSKRISTNSSGLSSRHKVCVICNTQDTPMWRKLDGKVITCAGNTLCNKCYMYRRNHGTLPAPTTPAVTTSLSPIKTQAANSISSSIACPTGSAANSMHLSGPVAPDTPQSVATSRHNTAASAKQAASPKVRRQRPNSPDYDYVPRLSNSSRSATASPKQSRRPSTASLGDRSQASSRQRSRLGRNTSNIGVNSSTTALKRTHSGGIAAASAEPFVADKRARYCVGLAASAALLAEEEEAAITDAAEILVELATTHAAVTGGVQDMFVDEASCAGKSTSQDCPMDLGASAAAVHHVASAGYSIGADIVHHTSCKDAAAVSGLQGAALMPGGPTCSGSSDLIMARDGAFHATADIANDPNNGPVSGTMAPVSSTYTGRILDLGAETFLPRLQPAELSMSGGDGRGKNFAQEAKGAASCCNTQSLAYVYTGVATGAELAAAQILGGSSSSAVAQVDAIGASAVAGPAQCDIISDMSITSIANHALAAVAAGQISADVCIAYLAGLGGGMHGAGPAGLNLAAAQTHFEAMQQQLAQSPELKQLLVQLTGAQC